MNDPAFPHQPETLQLHSADRSLRLSRSLGGHQGDPQWDDKDEMILPETNSSPPFRERKHTFSTSKIGSKKQHDTLRTLESEGVLLKSWMIVVTISDLKKGLPSQTCDTERRRVRLTHLPKGSAWRQLENKVSFF